MEKDYKKTGWVNGSEPDMDAEHMNNIEDGIDGLYHPEFDDSGTVEGITSFPAFLSTVINKMNPIAFYKNFKAGMKYVLHTGSLINNGLCTETGKYAADATQLNPNIENTLAWQVAKVNSDLAVQPVTNIDILTLGTGRYYATNCTNMPPGWLDAYLDVERLDNQWCRITAWPPYEGLESPYITKQSDGIWRDWRYLITDSTQPIDIASYAVPGAFNSLNQALVTKAGKVCTFSMMGQLGSIAAQNNRIIIAGLPEHIRPLASQECYAMIVGDTSDKRLWVDKTGNITLFTHVATPDNAYFFAGGAWIDN